MRGVTLIELMIALILGLLVVGAAIGIFLSNRRTYSATEGLGRVQENVRTAFELMARDVREASGNPCVNTVPIANVVNNKAANWYTNIDTWSSGITGVEGAFSSGSPANGTATGTRIAGTDALQILGSGYEVATIALDNTASATLTLNTTAAAAGISTGDVVVACNARQSAIFQVSAASGSNVVHAVSGVSQGIVQPVWRCRSVAARSSRLLQLAPSSPTCMLPDGSLVRMRVEPGLYISRKWFIPGVLCRSVTTKCWKASITCSCSILSEGSQRM